MKVGDDEWADKYRENLEKFNVNISHVETVTGKSTGIAQINVAESGENQIVIIPGANDVLSPTDIEKAQDVLDSSKVYLIDFIIFIIIAFLKIINYSCFIFFFCFLFRFWYVN